MTCDGGSQAFRRRIPARLLWTRTVRLADRARRIDQRRGPRFLGARNVAAASRGGLVDVSLEQVLAWDPEVIFATDLRFYRDVWTDERWAGVAAVKTRRVHLAPHLPFGWFDFPPGANRLIGLYWAGRALYPRGFPDDLRERAREFFDLFYHRRPSDAQLDALLSEPGVAPR